METKFSVMRAFGSEQFSTTVTFDKVATSEEVKQGLEALNISLQGAFDAVLVREQQEKEKLLKASAAREYQQRTLDDQLKNEQKSASDLKSTITKVDIKNNKKFQR